MTITGSNFNQATAARFGTTLAPAFTVVSANQITAIPRRDPAPSWSR